MINETCTQTNWVGKKELEDFSVPKKYYDWLVKPYVLSKALKQHAQVFNVEIMQQCITDITLDEKTALACYDEGGFFVREVHLMGNGIAWTYGRVIFPKQTQAILPSLNGVGESPIGEALFYSHPDMSRSEFEYKKLNTDDELFHAAIKNTNQQANELWARRSVFYLSQQPVLVIEVFLPKLPEY